MKKKIIKVIVNTLTLTRLVGAFLIPVINSSDNTILIITYLALLFVTDTLDGMLARKYGVSTKGGFHLDQFCDKVLGIVVLVSFIKKESLLLLLLILEFSIGLVNTIRASCGESGRSSTIGKIKTLVFSITLVLTAIDVYTFDILKNVNFIVNSIVKILILFTASLEILTLIGYIKEAILESKQSRTKLNINEKIKSIRDLKYVIGRLWDENMFLLDRDKSIQMVIEEELVKIHNIEN